MSEAAVKRMTLAEFLRWEDGTDTRYELLGGCPVAMAPPAIAHGILALRLGARIDAALRSRSPCFGQSEAGIARPDRNDTCYIADLAVTCTPPERGQQLLQDPLLIVEILSPGTALYDRQTKVSDYRRIPSVQEILLIDSASIFAEMLRREGDRWITEIVRGPHATLSLASIGLTAAMSELYEGIDLPDQAAAEP
ncbi:MAG TPA: Uma2 family endonuclease [Stellaceae bacterium]|jgi:Uma2 family endonuclease|nr:Uma2 family endonuclease [Stellaceae bacterium]HEX3416684.1 Uma2 family endonuclease [Stellaceae bacterium]